MRKREQDEFERVFRSAYRGVLHTAFVVLQDRGRAEEVTQDAFLRLYERWADVVLEHPEAWVRKVALRDAVRRAKRERVVPVVTASDSEVDRGDRLPDIDLLRAVGALPPQQRAAVALHYLEDRPVLQVAELMEVAPATVRQHLFKARAQLAARLGETVEEVVGHVDR